MACCSQVREAIGELLPAADRELDVGVLRRDLPGEGLGLWGVEQDALLAQVRRHFLEIHVGDDAEILSEGQRLSQVGHIEVVEAALRDDRTQRLVQKV